MKLRLLLVTLCLACLFTIPAAAQTNRYARIISESANLRMEPSVASVSQREIAEGTLVKVLDQELPWYVVRVRDSVGWVHGNTIEFVDAGEPGLTSRPRQIYQETLPVPRRPASGVHMPSSSRIYITGPRGGCYYISDSGRKVYVDHSMCN